MLVDRFHEQTFDLRQVKNLFGKGVKFGFGQDLCQRCNTLDGCTTGDKVVCPFVPIFLFIVGDSVFQTLLLVLLLCKLLLNFFFLGIQLGKVFLFLHCVTSFKISEIVVQTLRWKLSASADCFRCEVRWDSCIGSAREALPCTERSDAKQPGHATVRAIGSAGRTYSRQESIEVRP